MQNLYFFIVIVLMFGCKNDTEVLDNHFAKLKQQSPPQSVLKFKQLPLDSAVLFSDSFNDIFEDTSIKILSDSDESKAFYDFFKDRNIPLLGRQDKWTIVAAFHYYLNGKKYNINKIWNEMKEFSNKEYEKQYPLIINKQ
jgi:hypothetical protein